MGGGLGRGDHRDDRLADIEHAVDRQRLVRPGDLEVGQVAARDDFDHAGNRQRGRRVDATDPRARQRAEHEVDVMEAGDREVGRVARRARNLLSTLYPPGRGPHRSHHRHCP